MPTTPQPKPQLTTEANKTAHPSISLPERPVQGAGRILGYLEATTSVANPGTWVLGITRIIVGYLWFTQTLWKLPPDFGSPHLNTSTGLLYWMTKEAQHPFVPLFGSFVQHVIIPNFSLFGWLTWITETAIAISLFFGLFGRLGALIGTLWAFQLYIGLSKVPGEWEWTYIMLTLLNAVLCSCAAGRYLGIDQFLLPRLAGRGDRLSKILRLLL